MQLASIQSQEENDRLEKYVKDYGNCVYLLKVTSELHCVARLGSDYSESRAARYKNVPPLRNLIATAISTTPIRCW